MYIKFRPLLLIFGLIVLCSFGPPKKYLRKAGKQIDKGNINTAKNWYLKALAVSPDDYSANLNIGIMLSEINGNYTEALPYLEKALTATKKDTIIDLKVALAKCYQFHGDFNKALFYLNQLNNVVSFEDNNDFQKEIKKRKLDCEYAMAHIADPISNKLFIVNLGKTINTDAPEYVPVITPMSELIFTSKRKDDNKEKLNDVDLKYFESMYISKYNAGKFGQVRRYTLPDLYMKSKYRKSGESVVSMSADGKKLFVYKNAGLFEINTDDRSSKKPQKLSESINFDYYQNHAYLSKDGKTLYFTSESEGGLGGNDIYVSKKINETDWSKPENLGSVINTEYDEDSPFLSDDGNTLYFASKGHEGYGNFDMYKSSFVDGKWTKPENMGGLINSSGHDIFLIQTVDGNAGYFSSYRKGGYGDMDIYKINYTDKIDKACPATNNPVFVLQMTDDDKTDFKNKIEITYPLNYKVLEYEWKVNELVSTSSFFEYDYKAAGNYKVSSKVIAYCDTCLEPIIACYTYNNNFESLVAVTPTKTAEPIVTVDINKIKGQLTDEQLMALGFNVSPVYFDFNKTELRPDGLEILNTNAEVLKKYPTLKVELVGYADARGSESYNNNLSQERAKAAKKYLAEKGIKTTQVTTQRGQGEKITDAHCGGDLACIEQVYQNSRKVIFKVFKK